MSETSPKPVKLADGRQKGLSQWDLMYIKFRRHRLAMFSGIFLILVYIVILFAEFFSPYPTNEKFGKFVHTPPMPILFWDADGLSRPFVYGYKQELDIETFQRTYVADTTEKYYLEVFHERVGIQPAWASSPPISISSVWTNRA